MLKQKVYEKIEDMADYIERIIYENHEITESLNIETYTAIVNLKYNRFRIYLGTLCSTGNISVKYMTVEEEMIKAMMREVASNE